MAKNIKEIRVQPVESADDFTRIFYCVSEAFGRQAQDAVWIVTSPGWDTAEGQREGADKLAKRWQSVTKNKAGQPNTVFLKAIAVERNEDGSTKERIAGMAIWQQASFLEGHGDPPSDNLGSGLDTLDPTEKRFASQMFRSLWKRRVEYAREKATTDSPAIFVLDMCAVDPVFQKKGIAGKLVQWGLDEAERRGGLEATTEASSMGRAVYARLGFRPEGEGKDIDYIVDEEFAARDKPPNLFMRTGA